MKCPLMSTPLDAQGKVFTLLTQASGTEIGLTIRKCLMDGQINFVSQPHAGSTFTFTTFFQRCDRSAISESKPVMLHPLPFSSKGLSVKLVHRRPKRATDLSITCKGWQLPMMLLLPLNYILVHFLLSGIILFPLQCTGIFSSNNK